MGNRTFRIDLFKMAIYILKRCWLLILCGAIGFGYMYWNTTYRQVDTYTAFGTMYVYNGNPNVINYQYTNTSDLNSALQLLDTYMVVVRSNKVMDAVVDRLATDYPGITSSYVAATLSMGSVAETGVMRVSCRTDEPQKSADICNAVLDVAPAEIIRVVSAGSIEIIDYATAPLYPDGRSVMRNGLLGAVAGIALAGGLLVLLFLFNQKVASSKELETNYTPPVLASVKREKHNQEDPGSFILNRNSSMELIEGYAKLRMNLLYTLPGKDRNVVEITSAVSGEGKSTIAANLAVSCAMGGKKVLLIDADMRRACQQDVFHYHEGQPGLSEILTGSKKWKEVLIPGPVENMWIIPAGHLPPNPTELLEADAMQMLLGKVSEKYDLVLLDAPPINIVSDPLTLSAKVAGSLFVVRQDFSDHREIRKALISAEMTGMNILGFVFYGENLRQGSYYSKKYYKNYYHNYDTRNRVMPVPAAGASETWRTEANEEVQQNTAVPAINPVDPAAFVRRSGK